MKSRNDHIAKTSEKMHVVICRVLSVDQVLKRDVHRCGT